MSQGRRRRLAPNAIVKGSDFNQLLDLIEANQNLRVGPGLQMYRTSAGTFIAQMHRPEPSIAGSAKPGGDIQPPGVVQFLAIIIAYTQNPVIGPPLNGSDNQWRYTYHVCDTTLTPFDGGRINIGQQTPTGNVYPCDYTGYSWEFSQSDAWYRGENNTGTVYRGDCDNLNEARNGDYGIQGNGVDIEALKETNPNLDLQPIPRGTAVIISQVFDGVWTRSYFDYPNGIDGTCGA